MHPLNVRSSAGLGLARVRDVRALDSCLGRPDRPQSRTRGPEVAPEVQPHARHPVTRGLSGLGATGHLAILNALAGDIPRRCIRKAHRVGTGVGPEAHPEGAPERHTR